MKMYTTCTSMSASLNLPGCYLEILSSLHLGWYAMEAECCKSAQNHEVLQILAGLNSTSTVKSVLYQLKC